MRRTSPVGSSSSGRSTREDQDDKFQTPVNCGNPGDLGYQNYTVHEEYNAAAGDENAGGNEEHFLESGGDDD